MVNGFISGEQSIYSIPIFPNFAQNYFIIRILTFYLKIWIIYVIAETTIRHKLEPVDINEKM